MITIYTDSTSAINAFNKKTIKSHTIKQCIEELNNSPKQTKYQQSGYLDTQTMKETKLQTNQLTVSISQIDNDTAEIETATHILCECPVFSTIRLEIYGSFTQTPDQLFYSKDTATNFKNIVKFIKKTKCFERKPKLTKKDLSPRKVNKKRKNITQNTNQKRIKINTIGKYYHKNNPGDMN